VREGVGAVCRTTSARVVSGAGVMTRASLYQLFTIIPSPERETDPREVTVLASCSVIIWSLKTGWNEIGGLVHGGDEFWDGSGLVRRRRVLSSSCIIHCPTRIVAPITGVK